MKVQDYLFRMQAWDIEQDHSNHYFVISVLADPTRDTRLCVRSYSSGVALRRDPSLHVTVVCEFGVRCVDQDLEQLAIEGGMEGCVIRKSLVSRHRYVRLLVDHRYGG